jgi:hypothetical protein
MFSSAIDHKIRSSRSLALRPLWKQQKIAAEGNCPMHLRLTRSYRLSILIFAALCCPQFSPVADGQSQTVRKTLDKLTELQGYPCAKGYAWFFLDGPMRRCTVDREVAFGEATVPAGSMIALTREGKPDFVQLSHDTVIAGSNCGGGGWLGLAEGLTTSFYPSGKLKQCFLASDQTVQGVPCMNGGFFGDGMGGGTKFREDGTLASCRLAKDFGKWRRGERFVRVP